jgi:hypothetical protein
MNDDTLPGSPFDILRAVSSVERPRPVGGELHFLEKDVYYYNEIPNLSIKNNNNGGQLGYNEYNLNI